MMETCYGQMGSLFRSGKSKPFPILIAPREGASVGGSSKPIHVLKLADYLNWNKCTIRANYYTQKRTQLPDRSGFSVALKLLSMNFLSQKNKLQLKHS